MSCVKEDTKWQRDLINFFTSKITLNNKFDVMSAQNISKNIGQDVLEQIKVN